MIESGIVLSVMIGGLLVIVTLYFIELGLAFLRQEWDEYTSRRDDRRRRRADLERASWPIPTVEDMQQKRDEYERKTTWNR